MQIIIAGCGKVGTTLVEQLSGEGNNVTVIDQNYEKVQDLASEYDVMGVVGNAASHRIQLEAGIEEADVLIAVTGSDELNLLCCLIAKKAGDCRDDSRVRNPVYGSEVEFIKGELGLATIINPEFAAAMEIARVLSFPSAIKIDTFAKGKVELLKFKLSPQSPIDGMSLVEITTRLNCHILVCAVQRGGEVYIPSGDFVLQSKDIIHFVASHKNAIQFFEKIGVGSKPVKSTMIVGGGEIAYYLATRLLQRGIGVTIIEKDRDRCDELSELLPKALIINGDGSDQSLLLEEQLSGSEAFVALTNIDEENIFLSLYAREQFHMKTITKVNRITFYDVINSLDLDTIIYPKNVTAEYIIQFIRAMKNSIGSNVERLYRLLENRVEALEFFVREDSAVTDISLEELQLKKNLLIACIYRNGDIITPKGQDRIQKGDTVIVVTTIRGLNDIRDILKN